MMCHLEWTFFPVSSFPLPFVLFLSPSSSFSFPLPLSLSLFLSVKKETVWGRMRDKSEELRNEESDQVHNVDRLQKSAGDEHFSRSPLSSLSPFSLSLCLSCMNDRLR